MQMMGVRKTAFPQMHTKSKLGSMKKLGTMKKEQQVTESLPNDGCQETGGKPSTAQKGNVI
jgi:hypothetical protein